MHVKEQVGTQSCYHGFTKYKSYQTTKTAFCDKTTGFVPEGRAEDDICLDSGEVFITVSHDILLSKLGCYGKDG